MVGNFNSTCELLSPPMDEGTILVYCCPSTFSLTVTALPPLPPSQTKCTVYTESVWLWGGGGCCIVLQTRSFTVHSVSDQTKNLQIASPPKTNITSKDDIQGLGSLKFLRPWSQVTEVISQGTQVLQEQNMLKGLLIKTETWVPSETNKQHVMEMLYEDISCLCCKYFQENIKFVGEKSYIF